MAPLLKLSYAEAMGLVPMVVVDLIGASAYLVHIDKVAKNHVFLKELQWEFPFYRHTGYYSGGSYQLLPLENPYDADHHDKEITTKLANSVAYYCKQIDEFQLRDRELHNEIDRLNAVAIKQERIHSQAREDLRAQREELQFSNSRLAQENSKLRGELSNINERYEQLLLVHGLSASPPSYIYGYGDANL